MIRLSAFLGWSSLKVYEDIADAEEYIMKPYKSVTEEDWASLVCVSWRWSERKPAAKQGGFSPMSQQQYLYLQHVLRNAAEHGLRYVWMAWCCAPQYCDGPLTEVILSKVGATCIADSLQLPYCQQSSA